MASAVLMGMFPRSALPWGWTALTIVALLALPASARAQQATVVPAPVQPAVPVQSEPQAVPPAQPAPGLPGAQPSEPQMPPPALAQPAKPENIFDALGRWLDKSAADFKASVDESNAKWREFGEKSGKAAKDAAAAQKQAAEALMKLPNTRVVEGRQVCEVAPNGAPDCQAAATEICRSKGYATGKSADIQTSRKCSAKAWLTRSEKVCVVETTVVKATCQ